MAKPTRARVAHPTATQAIAALTAAGVSPETAQLVSGNASLAASAAIYKPRSKTNPSSDRNQIAKPAQIEAYRQVRLTGEARSAVVLFSSMAGRAEIGVSEPQTMAHKAKWVSVGPEVDALADLAPTVRERTKLIRDYMTHWTIAGECYLIARAKVQTDPGYIRPPEVDGQKFSSWEEYAAATEPVDVLDPDFDPEDYGDPNTPIWEIVAVTEIRKTGNNDWQVRHDNETWLELTEDDPVIRLWNPDPENRREAWSPIMAMAGTLREIEWLTRHIFTQVRSRLLSAGMWFLPENMTYPPPSPDAIEGGEEAIALLNEAEKFMLSLAESGMQQLEADEVSFPSIIMTDAAALAQIDKSKLIQFWSEIDDKAMTLRDAAIRRFADGFDLTTSKVSEPGNSSGSTGNGGSNHWQEWAKQEQAISDYVSPALDSFVGNLTASFLRSVVPNTRLVLAYDTANMRLKQDRSKEAIELHQMGLLNRATTLRETGFDPENDMMDDEEFKRWVLVKMIGGSPTPEQVAEAVKILTGLFMPIDTTQKSDPKGRPGRHEPSNTDSVPVQGPPQGDHEHQPAPYSVLHASCEGLVLRALEKAGNRLLNEGKRGKDRDRTTPPTTAHLVASIGRTYIGAEFDFSMVDTVFPDLNARQRNAIRIALSRFCARLYNEGLGYTREGLMEALG